MSTIGTGGYNPQLNTLLTNLNDRGLEAKYQALKTIEDDKTLSVKILEIENDLNSINDPAKLELIQNIHMQLITSLTTKTGVQNGLLRLSGNVETKLASQTQGLFTRVFSGASPKLPEIREQVQKLDKLYVELQVEKGSPLGKRILALKEQYNQLILQLAVDDEPGSKATSQTIQKHLNELTGQLKNDNTGLLCIQFERLNNQVIKYLEAGSNSLKTKNLAPAFTVINKQLNSHISLSSRGKQAAKDLSSSVDETKQEAIHSVTESIAKKGLSKTSLADDPKVNAKNALAQVDIESNLTDLQINNDHGSTVDSGHDLQSLLHSFGIPIELVKIIRPKLEQITEPEVLKGVIADLLDSFTDFITALDALREHEESYGLGVAYPKEIQDPKTDSKIRAQLLNTYKQDVANARCQFLLKHLTGHVGQTSYRSFFLEKWSKHISKLVTEPTVKKTEEVTKNSPFERFGWKRSNSKPMLKTPFFKGIKSGITKSIIEKLLKRSVTTLVENTDVVEAEIPSLEDHTHLPHLKETIPDVSDFAAWFLGEQLLHSIANETTTPPEAAANNEAKLEESYRNFLGASQKVVLQEGNPWVSSFVSNVRNKLETAVTPGALVDEASPKLKKWLKKDPPLKEIEKEKELLKDIRKQTPLDSDQLSEMGTHYMRRAELRHANVPGATTIKSRIKKLRNPPIDIDISKSLTNFSKAANEDPSKNVGFFHAALHLARINPSLVFQFIEKWAQDNPDNPIGDAILGALYEHGLGVEKNISKAHQFYTKNERDPFSQSLIRLSKAPRILAARNGHIEARREYARWAIENSKTETTEVPKLLREETKRGDPESFYLLAQCYEKGIGVKADHFIAKALYSEAAKLGYPGALGEEERLANENSLRERDKPINGEYYYSEALNEKNLIKQLDHYRKAANLGHEKAILYLGNYHLKRNDYSKATFWFARAPAPDNNDQKTLFTKLQARSASIDVAQRQNLLGICHEVGIGCPINPTSAETCYTNAAKESHSASYNLGRVTNNSEHYLNAFPLKSGEEIPTSTEPKLLRKQASNGDLLAKRAVAKTPAQAEEAARARLVVEDIPGIGRVAFANL